MLIRFRVSNFRSIRDTQELSLVASSREDRENVFHDEATGFDLLRVAAIYGANAAGKTNVLAGLEFLQKAVRESHTGWKPEEPIPWEPFLLDAESRARPMAFEVDFLVAGTRYQYGVELDADRVGREWLHAYPSQRRQVWFERDAGVAEPFTFGKHLKGNNRTIESLTRKNSLFLSVAASNNHQALLPVYLWFVENLRFQAPANRSAQNALDWLSVNEDDGRRDRVLSLLRLADLGIVGLEVRREPIHDYLATAFRASLEARRRQPDDAMLLQLKTLVEKGRPRLVLQHQSRDGAVSFNLENESHGTKAWLSLVCALLNALENGGIVSVDELDASLHPHLCVELLRLFQHPAWNPKGAQLIFNTHDTTLLGNLLGEPGLHRDQVWFVEKDSEGATHLYPLTDFSPRKDENLERGYLQGRYGAIPFIEPSSWSADA
jgi:predicted ATPase